MFLFAQLAKRFAQNSRGLVAEWQKTCFRSALSAPFCKTCGFYRWCWEGLQLRDPDSKFSCRSWEEDILPLTLVVSPSNPSISWFRFWTPRSSIWGWDKRKEVVLRKVKGKNWQQHWGLLANRFHHECLPFYDLHLKVLQLSASSPPHKLNLNVLISYCKVNF